MFMAVEEPARAVVFPDVEEAAVNDLAFPNTDLGRLERQSELKLVAAKRRLDDIQLGDVGPLYEYARDTAVQLENGLVDEVDNRVSRRAVVILQHKRCAQADVGLSFGVDTVQQFDEALIHDLGQHIGD